MLVGVRVVLLQGALEKDVPSQPVILKDEMHAAHPPLLPVLSRGSQAGSCISPLTLGLGAGTAAVAFACPHYVNQRLGQLPVIHGLAACRNKKRTARLYLLHTDPGAETLSLRTGPSSHTLIPPSSGGLAEAFPCHPRRLLSATCCGPLVLGPPSPVSPAHIVERHFWSTLLTAVEPAPLRCFTAVGLGSAMKKTGNSTLVFIVEVKNKHQIKQAVKKLCGTDAA
ncbi:unnamed protein product, partial [Rangifer tarandus platyrhynchus]